MLENKMLGLEKVMGYWGNRDCSNFHCLPAVDEKNSTEKGTYELGPDVWGGKQKMEKEFQPEGLASTKEQCYERTSVFKKWSSVYGDRS